MLLHLALGPRESYDAWLGFLQDLSARGVKEPLMVIFDGAPGLRKAVRRMWPRAFRQRCQVHTMRNILAKLPRLMQASMKRLVQQVFLAPSDDVALKRGRALMARFRDRYPAAMECLERDLEACVTDLRFPGRIIAGFARRTASNAWLAKGGAARRSSRASPRSGRA